MTDTRIATVTRNLGDIITRFDERSCDNKARTKGAVNADRPLTRSSDLNREGIAMEATRPTCSVADCDAQAIARGWCKSHYSRWKNSGTADRPLLRERHTGCSIDGCDKPHVSRGWCGKHYQNWNRTGNPVCDPTDPVVRVMRMVTVVDAGYASPCWNSGYSKNNAGYAFVRLRDRSRVGVHRIMYEAHKSPIPEGHEVDHLCFNPACCNPDHLEAVTPSENKQRRRPQLLGLSIPQREARGL